MRVESLETTCSIDCGTGVAVTSVARRTSAAGGREWGRDMGRVKRARTYVKSYRARDAGHVPRVGVSRAAFFLFIK